MYETSFTDKRRSSFLFTENHIFIEEEINPADKVVTVEEVLDRININGIGNLVDFEAATRGVL